MEKMMLYLVVICFMINIIGIFILGIYNIYKDRISKETMFQLQLMSTENASIKDAPEVATLYKVIDDTIKFYTARRLKVINLTEKSDQELSIVLDDVILSISSDVELHLSSQFKKIWEVYFDPIPTDPDDPPSHLNLYIHDNTELMLVRTIEAMKRNRVDNSEKTNKPN